MNPLWTKAPFVYFRFPGLFMAVAAGMAMLALILGGYPMLMSSTENGLLSAALAQGTMTKYGAGVHYEATNVALTRSGPVSRRPREVGTAHQITSLFERRTSSIPGLGSTLVSMTGPALQLSASGETRPGRLLSRTDALRHVEITQSTGRKGAWISDLTARGLNVEPGDEINLTTQAGRTTGMLVQGIYRALYAEPPSGYWRNFGQLIFVQCPDCSPPPPFVILGRDLFRETMRDLRVPEADFDWDAPLASTDITIDRARSIAGRFDDFVEDARAGGPASDILHCCFSGFLSYNDTALTSSIAQAIAQVEDRMISTEVPAKVVLVTAIVVALAGIAASGGYNVAARAPEFRVLAARGHGPLSLGLRSAIEAVLPALVGTAAGGVVAFGAVEALVGRAPISPSAFDDIQRGLGVSAILAVFLIAFTASVSTKLREPGRSSHGRLLIPWEVLPIVAAGWSYAVLSQRSDLITAAPREASPLLLILPLTLIVAGAALGGRLARSLFRYAANVAPRSPATFLALRRVATSDGLAIALMGACAVASAVFVLSSTLATSLASTLDSKAYLFVGSDVAATVPPIHELPSGFGQGHTKVIRVVGVSSADGVQVDVLAVDPDELGRAAYWRSDFGTPTIDAAVAGLQSTRSTIPVVTAGPELPRDEFVLTVDDVPFRVSVTSSLDAFPGMTSRRPLVVIDRKTFSDGIAAAGSGLLSSYEASTQHWIRGDTDDIVAELDALADAPYDVATVDELKDLPSLNALIEAFRILGPLAVLAWAGALGAVVTYLQTRNRRNLVSYALSRRMGLEHRMHRKALVFELLGLLLFGYIVAVTIGLAAARVTMTFIDPLPALPLRAFLVLPSSHLVVGAVATIVVAIVASAYVNRLASRANVAVLMRTSE